MGQIQQCGLVAWCALMAQMGIADVAAGQPSAPTCASGTADRLLTPEDGDWMSYRRTYDVTGFSPLDQVNRGHRLVPER